MDERLLILVAAVVVCAFSPWACLVIAALGLVVGYLAGQPLLADAGKAFGLVFLAYLLIVVVLLGMFLGVAGIAAMGGLI